MSLHVDKLQTKLRSEGGMNEENEKESGLNEENGEEPSVHQHVDCSDAFNTSQVLIWFFVVKVSEWMSLED